MYLTFMHFTCQFGKHRPKLSFLSENYEQTFPHKNRKISHKGGRGWVGGRRSYSSWVTVLWEVHQLEGVCPPC